MVDTVQEEVKHEEEGAVRQVSVDVEQETVERVLEDLLSHARVMSARCRMTMILCARRRTHRPNHVAGQEAGARAAQSRRETGSLHQLLRD